MYTKTLFITAAVLLILPLTAAAQDDEEYVYATYFECDPSMEWLADGVFEMVQKPAYDKAVEDGALNGFGWLVHHTGGTWRRALWRSADSVDELMASFEVLADNTDDEAGNAGAQFSKICSRHEDYIWQSVAGSSSPGEVESDEGVGISVYYRCDQNREERADELVTDTIAPLYQAQIDAGNIRSWGWMRHIVGGEIRRIATMRADDWSSLFKARNAIIESMGEGDMSDAGEEFTAICGSHEDYLWVMP
ncbi:MAG: hypothetical protein ACNS61_16430 [Candidatus Wenzhouxiangella sp. M2_3B_020]